MSVELAWRSHARALAAWAWARFVNRTNSRGGYWPPEEWEKTYVGRDGVTRKLGKTTTRHGEFSQRELARHFDPRGRADIVGLHSTSPDNTSLWGGIDIDFHGEG